MYKVTVCGHLGEGNNFVDGQTVKTKNIYNALEKYYGKDKVTKIDTYNWKKTPIKFFFNCILAMKKTENIIILPAHNGVKVFVPLFTLLKKCKVFYAVVGGWLSDLLKKNKWLIKYIKKLDKVFVETNRMKQNLNKMDITNVDILVNFKDIKPLKEEALIYEHIKPYKLCTFSRVMKEKGIEDAIETIKRINEEKKEIIYTLDIYGPIDENYKEQFEEIISKAPNYLQYKGCIDSDKSVGILKDYYFLLFPTRFKTEGIPGTIIDAFSAGVPVIYSSWENCDEILQNNVTGIQYEFGNIEDFKKKLENSVGKENILKMKKQCLIAAKKYTEEYAINNIIGEF